MGVRQNQTSKSAVKNDLRSKDFPAFADRRCVRSKPNGVLEEMSERQRKGVAKAAQGCVSSHLGTGYEKERSSACSASIGINRKHKLPFMSQFMSRSAVEKELPLRRFFF